MKKEIKLEVSQRTEENGQVNELRSKDFIPAILYGSVTDSQKIKIKKRDFEAAFNEAGESQLVDLFVDEKGPVKVLIKDIQRDPVKDNIIHADFYQVDMNKKIEIEIPINFIGEAPAVKELGGTLVKNVDAIQAKCLPGDLIENLDLDLSSLKSYEDYIRVKDLSIPDNIEVFAEGENIIAHVIEPEVEEEPVVEEEAAEGEEGEEGEAVEGEEGKKEEGDKTGDESVEKKAEEKDKK